MRALALILALWMLPAYGAMVTDEEMAHCVAEGGCALVTKLWLQQRLEEAREEGRKNCKNKT